MSDLNKKWLSCVVFFEKLIDLLNDSYDLIGSINHDSTMYLIPKGSEGQLSYMSKPPFSFRLSDHWTWYANVNKCPNENYIQCLNVDGPWVKPRKAPGKPSAPISMSQVAITDEKGVYHAVFGETFDRKTKSWNWLDKYDPVDVIDLYSISMRRR